MKTGIIGLALALGLTSAAQAAGYKEIEVKDGGTIKGTVKYTGAVPPKKSISKDTEVCGTSTEDVSISAVDGKLASVVVYLKKVKKGKAFTAEQKKVLSDQKACVFLPHVALVAEGGVVSFKNSDSVLHNVKSTSLKNPAFNEGVGADKAIDKTFKKGHEAVKISCSVHEWMSAWVVVMPHPYYAVTNDKGEFTLTNVPAGKYKLIVWHGSLGKECKVSVDGGGAEKQKNSGVKVEVGKGGEVKVEATFE